MEKNKVENYTEEQRAEINEITERQYRKMLAEGKYKDLLIKFGQNGNYSVSNMLYLLSQNPDITVVKGMNEWERAGRHIKEGAKSMEIMAPTKVKYNVKVTNPDGSPKFDEDGEQIVRAFIPTMCLIFRIRRAQSMFRIKSTRYPMRKSVLFLTAYSMRCPAEGTSISSPTSRSSRRAKHIKLIKRKERSDCARA